MRFLIFRNSEAISLAVFAFLTATALCRATPGRGRALIIGIVGIAICLGLPALISPVRDWMPALLILLVYWQAGAIVIPENRSLQSLLGSIDARIAAHLRPLPQVLRVAFELAYLFCYILVPCGVLALYLLHQGRLADRYWTVVLPPAYCCYILVPFARTLPPRLASAAPPSTSPTGVRALNLVILDIASIQANTFPSAHVAASIAAAVFLCGVSPTFGSVFLAVAIGIGAGAFLGRYHYFLDVVLGAVLGLAAALIL